MTDFENDNSDVHANIVQGIFKAAAEGNTKGIVEGFNILPSLSRDCRDKRGWTPLMLATRNGHIKVIEALLEDGADPNAFNNSGQNTFDVASFWNQSSALKTLKGFLKPPKTPELEFVNYFSHSVVNRQSYKRNDQTHIDAVMKNEKSRFVVFAELRLLSAKIPPPGKGSQILYLSWKDMEPLLPKLEHDLIFLGVGDIEEGLLLRETISTNEDKFVYFAVNFKQIPAEEQLPISSRNGEYVGRGYDAGITFVRKKESGLIAQARSVLAWHDKYIYCPTCGHKTVMGDSGYKRICTSTDCLSLKGAHNTSFPRTDPVIIALVISMDGTKCLLGRQKRFPPQVYSCIAGFMEPGETIEDAARREIMEEAGVKVGKLQYHSSQPWPFPSNLMIGLIGHAVCDDITVDEVELEDAKWFERSAVIQALNEGVKSDGLRIPPPMAIAHQLIKAWVKMPSNL